MLPLILCLCFSAVAPACSFAAETAKPVPDAATEAQPPNKDCLDFNGTDRKQLRAISKNVDEELRRFEDLSKLPVAPYEFSKYFFFSEPGDEFKINVQPKLNATLKPWTEDEKSAVEAALTKILAPNPGLLKHLSTNGLVALNRRDKSDEERRGAASTGPTYINVYDGSFKKGSTYTLEHIFRHELMHVADSGHQISHSKSWTHYAGPLITPVRNSIRSNLFDCSKHPAGWELIGHYGTTNLSESLPEFFINDAYKSSENPAVKAAARAIFDPTPRELAFAMYYKSAIVNLYAGRVDYGLEQLERASKLEPDAPLVLYYLAYYKNQKNQLECASRYVKDAEAIYVERGIARDELQRVYLTRLKLAIEHKLTSGCSPALLNELLSIHPTDKQALDYRAESLERRKQFGLAALDRYNMKMKSGILTFRVLDFENEQSLESYNALLKRRKAFVRSEPEFRPRQENLGVALQRRALFVENFGDVQTDAKQRDFLYEVALKDYRTSAGYECSLVNALVGAGRVCLKLRKTDEAKVLVDDLHLLKKELPAIILNLLVLDAENKTSQSAKLYKFFLTELANQ